jgi:hypothetical protein
LKRDLEASGITLVDYNYNHHHPARPAHPVYRRHIRSTIHYISPHRDLFKNSSKNFRESFHPTSFAFPSRLIRPRILTPRSRHTPASRYHPRRSGRTYPTSKLSYKMDPHRNPGLHDAKLQSTLHSQNNTSRRNTESDEMPAPPAYHMVVDPTAPIPNLRNPYDPEEEEEEDEKDDDDTPEITINAATQVRGNGNIISITQMDSVRIANLIATMLQGPKAPEPTSPQTLPSLASMTSEPKPTRQYPRVNITVNCGATVIGDRNIVGPGLGDIARQMQVAQRNQAVQAQQTHTAQAQRAAATRETLYHAQAAIAQHHGLFATQGPTPPMSRTSSLQSDGTGGTKRKAEDDVTDGGVKRHC